MSTITSPWPSNDAQRPAPGWGRTALLIVGFLALTVGALAAHATPASQYEISIYSGTPTAFWIAAGIAFVISLLVAARPPADGGRPWALLLGGQTIVAVVGLPLLRGYAFYGTGDPLSHLGWVRSVLAGDLALSTLIYPGLHSVSIFLSQLLGVELGRAMLLATGLYVVSFFVFVPMLVYVIADDREAAVYGAFSAFLLLPINGIGLHLTAFPSTIAVFFVPLVLVLLVVHVTRRDRGGWSDPVGVLLALAMGTTVLLHPQQASNLFLLFLATTVLVPIGARVGLPLRDVRAPVGHTLLLAGTLVAWGSSHERVTDAVSAYSTRVVGAFVGSGSSGTNVVAQRSGSLGAIGVSVAEIGVKLFLVSFVFLALTALLVGADLGGLIDRLSARDRTVPLFGLGLVPVGAVMLAYMAGGLQSIYFRHLGFIMVLATVLGSIAIWRGVRIARRRGRFRSAVTTVVVLAFVTMSVLSLVTVYSSPYIYKAGGHVTDQHVDGYEMAFAYESDTVPYLGIRTGPDRFRDGIAGVTDLQSRSERRANRVPFGSLDADLAAELERPHYVVMTDADVRREVTAFRELRYSERGFRTLGDRPGVDRVAANEGFQLYHVAG